MCYFGCWQASETASWAKWHPGCRNWLHTHHKTFRLLEIAFQDSIFQLESPYTHRQRLATLDSYLTNVSILTSKRSCCCTTASSCRLLERLFRCSMLITLLGSCNSVEKACCDSHLLVYEIARGHSNEATISACWSYSSLPHESVRQTFL